MRPLVRHSSVGDDRRDRRAVEHPLDAVARAAPLPIGKLPVGTYDAVPWQILVSGGKDTPNEAGGAIGSMSP